MHIPDGFLSTPVWAVLDAASLPALGYMARRASSRLEEARVPLLGVMGAFVFAAQMINFPVGIGTSGHLVGAALLVYTIGPAAASIVMTAILAVQALVFQDGGLLALGPNVFNMAFAGVLAAWIPFRFWGRWHSGAVFLGAALSVLVSACLALLELRLSSIVIPKAAVVVSLGLFVVAALLEGVITLAALRAIERINPNWIRKPVRSPLLAGFASAAVLLAVVGVLFASTAPDGLEAFAEAVGIAAHARTFISSPLSDYELAGLSSEWLRRASAGLVGLTAVFAVCLGVGRLLSRRTGVVREKV